MKALFTVALVMTLSTQSFAGSVPVNEIIDTMSKSDLLIVQQMVRTNKQITSKTWDSGNKHITVYHELTPAESKCRPVQLVSGKMISDFFSCEVEPNKYFLFDDIPADVD
jgi:hypothetical protein